MDEKGGGGQAELQESEDVPSWTGDEGFTIIDKRFNGLQLLNNIVPSDKLARSNPSRAVGGGFHDDKYGVFRGPDLFYFLRRYYTILIAYIYSVIHSGNQTPTGVIYVIDKAGELSETTMLADTGSDFNIISWTRVAELGKTSEIEYRSPALMPQMNGIKGGRFQPKGYILLRWRSKRHSKLHTEWFWVVEGCPVEIVFGESYVRELGLVRYNWGSVLINVIHKQIGETEADKEAEKRRKEEKAALEAKKLKYKQRTALAPLQPATESDSSRNR